MSDIWTGPYESLHLGPASETKRVLARCPLGGFAPCIDDLCRGGGDTLCGLEPGFDFCRCGYIPETCPDCRSEDDEYYDDYGDDEAV